MAEIINVKREAIVKLQLSAYHPRARKLGLLSGWSRDVFIAKNGKRHWYQTGSISWQRIVRLCNASANCTFSAQADHLLFIRVYHFPGRQINEQI